MRLEGFKHVRVTTKPVFFWDPLPSHPFHSTLRGDFGPDKGITVFNPTFVQALPFNLFKFYDRLFSFFLITRQNCRACQKQLK